MNNAKVITVTLNPSLDETITINHLNLGYHNLTADTMQLDASGRGVNVSYALSQLEIPTHALVLLGNDAMGHAYKGLLTEQNFPSTIVRRPGHTRSDTILFDKAEQIETHVIDEGTGFAPDTIEKVIDHLQTLIEPQDTVVLAGNLPREVAPDTYAKIASIVKQIGATVVVMIGHQNLDVVLQTQPDLLVLTRQEAETYFNFPVRTFADMLTTSTKFLERGVKQVMMVVDTFDGAVFVTPQDKWMVQMNTEKVGTDSGVVDAMLAGYLAGHMTNRSLVDTFKLGASAMVYTSTKVGNQFGTMPELQETFASIDAHIVEEQVNI